MKFFEISHYDNRTDGNVRDPRGKELKMVTYSPLDRETSRWLSPPDETAPSFEDARAELIADYQAAVQGLGFSVADIFAELEAAGVDLTPAIEAWRKAWM